MKYFTRGPNTTDLDINNIFTGVMPRRFFFGMLRQGAFDGEYARDPYNFQHFGLEKYSFDFGQESASFQPVEVDFANGMNTFAHHQLSRAVRGPLAYTIDEYNNPHCLFGVDLSVSQNDDCFEILKQGSANLRIKLRAVVDHAIVIVVFAEYDSEIEVNKDRQVIKRLFA